LQAATGPQGIPGPTGPAGGAACAITGNAFALQNDSIAVIAPNTHQEIDAIALPGGAVPNAFAVNPSNGDFYVGTDDGLLILDAQGGELDHLRAGNDITDVAYNPTADRFYIADKTNTQVLTYDADTLAHLNTVPVFNEAVLAVDPVVNKVFAAAPGEGIFVIDGQTGDFDYEIQQDAGKLAADPTRHRLYASDFSGNVFVIDTQTNGTLSSFESGGRYPLNLAANPNNGLVYVNHGDVIELYNPGSGSHVDSIYVAAEVMDIDPVSDLVYLYGNDAIQIYSGSTSLYVDSLNANTVLGYAFDTQKDCAGGATGPTGPTGPGACSEPAYAFFASASGSENEWTKYNPNLRTSDITSNGPPDIRYTAADPALSKVYATSIHNWLAYYSNGAWGTYALGYALGRPVVNTASHLVYVPNLGLQVVHVFDGVSNQALDDIIVNETPLDAAVDSAGNRLYVSTNQEIEVRDLRGIFLYAIPAPLAERLKVNPCNGDLYAAFDSGGVKVYDGKTGALKRTLDIDTLNFDIDTGTNQLAVWTRGQHLEVYDLCTGQMQWDEYRGIPDYAGLGVTVDPVNHLLYFANNLSSRVEVYSLASGDMIDQLTVDGLSSDVAVLACGGGCRPCCDPCAGATGPGCTTTGSAYALQENEIAVIDPHSHEETGSIPILTSLPNDLAVNPSDGNFYVATTDGLAVLDAQGSTIVTLSPGDDIFQVVYNPTANKFYYTDNSIGDVNIYDAATLIQLDIIHVNNHSTVLAVDPVVNKVFAAAPGEGIFVIDGETDGVDYLIELDIGQLAIDPTRHTLYASDFNGNVFLIDTRDNSTLYSYALTSGTPQLLAVNPNTDRLYAVYDADVEILNASDGEWLSFFSANNVTAIAVDPVTNQVYYHSGANVTTILDGNDESVLGAIAMENLHAFAFSTREECGPSSCPGIFVAGAPRSLVDDHFNAGFVSFSTTEIDLGGAVSTADGMHFTVNSAGVYEIDVRLPIRSNQIPEYGSYQFEYAVEVNGVTIYSADLANTNNLNWRELITEYVQLFKQLSAGDEITVAIMHYGSSNPNEDYFEQLSLAIHRIC